MRITKFVMGVLTGLFFLMLVSCKGQVSDVDRKTKMLQKTPGKTYCHGLDGIRMVVVSNAEAIEYIRSVGHFPACSDYLKWREKNPKKPAVEEGSTGSD